jgi:hypothetical protein
MAAQEAMKDDPFLMALFVAHQAAEQKAKEVAEAKVKEAMDVAAQAGARREQAAAGLHARQAPASSGEDADMDPRDEARRKIPAKHPSPSSDESSDLEEPLMMGTLAQELAEKLGLGADGVARVRAVVVARHARSTAAAQPNAGSAAGSASQGGEPAPPSATDAAHAGQQQQQGGEPPAVEVGTAAPGQAKGEMGEPAATAARTRSRSPRISSADL